MDIRFKAVSPNSARLDLPRVSRIRPARLIPPGRVSRRVFQRGADTRRELQQGSAAFHDVGNDVSLVSREPRDTADPRCRFGMPRRKIAGRGAEEKSGGVVEIDEGGSAIGVRGMCRGI